MRNGLASTGDKTKNSLSIVVLGILFSLTVGSALNHTFKHLSAYTTGQEALNAFSNDCGREIVIMLQLLVFLFTLARFYLGAYRYAEEVSRNIQTIWNRIVNTSCTIILFSGFYICSLTLRSTTLFYWIIVLVFGFDWLWFYLAGAILRVPSEIRGIITVWGLFDAFTMLSVSLCMGFILGTRLAQIISVTIIFGIGVLDLYWFRRFYTDESGWQQNTRYLN